MYTATAVTPRIEAIMKEFDQFQQRQAQIDAQIVEMKNELVRLNLLSQFDKYGVIRSETAWFHDGQTVRARANGLSEETS